MKVDFEREKAWWDAKASKQDAENREEWVNKARCWREIDRILNGVESILDIGAGTAAFLLL